MKYSGRLGLCLGGLVVGQRSATDCQQDAAESKLFLTIILIRNSFARMKA